MRHAQREDNGLKLATVSVDGRPTSVALLGNGMMLDIARAADAVSSSGGDALEAGTLQQIIEGGDSALHALHELVARAEAGELADHQHAADSVVLLAPIPLPKKNVFCVGRNYAEHIAEGEKAQKVKIGVTEHPVFFTKPPTSIVPPHGDVLIFPRFRKPPTTRSNWRS